MKKLLLSVATTYFFLQQLASAASVWQSVPGLANDIGIGANGSVWIIGTDREGDSGFGVHRWTGNSWQKISGGGKRIDVDPQGNPWVVNNQGRIWRYSVNAGKWQSIPGTANDIGIGANGAVWIIGTDSQGGYGYGVHRWTGSGWKKISGGAKRIDVDHTGSPWVVNNQGSVYRYNVKTNSWETKPGQGNDIGIGRDIVWKIGKTSVAGYGYKIEKWGGASWNRPVDGAAEQISVEPNGKAWTVNKQKKIYRMHTSVNTPSAGSSGVAQIPSPDQILVCPTNEYFTIARWKVSHFTNRYYRWASLYSMPTEITEDEYWRNCPGLLDGDKGRDHTARIDNRTGVKGAFGQIKEPRSIASHARPIATGVLFRNASRQILELHSNKRR